MDILTNKISKEDFHISNNLDQNNPSFIYGEVCFIELAEIIQSLELTDRLFLDIGSGCGKIVVYLAKKFNLLIDGIEIDTERYTKSLELVDKFNMNNNIYLFNNDFRKIYFGNYDVLYCCNLVFSKDDNNDLFKKILVEFNGYLFLFYYNYHIKKYFIKFFEIKTSWNPKQRIFLFYIK